MADGVHPKESAPYCTSLKGSTMFAKAQRACDGSATPRGAGSVNAAACSDAIAHEGSCAVAPPTEGHTFREPERAVRDLTEPGVDVAARRLLAAMSRGRRSALRRLHSLYFARLVNFFLHLAPMSPAAVIEDLVADTMFDVWRTSASLERSCSIHVAIMRIAWAHAGQRVVDGGGAPSPTQQSSSAPQSRSRPSSTPKLPPLSDVLATLHLNERAVVHLVHSGHSREEVADILRISCTTVDTYWASSMIALHPWLVARHSPTLTDR
jgi:DNA-directed RNA polymerase specialized sigma24 family protein